MSRYDGLDVDELRLVVAVAVGDGQTDVIEAVRQHKRARREGSDA